MVSPWGNHHGHTDVGRARAACALGPRCTQLNGGVSAPRRQSSSGVQTGCTGREDTGRCVQAYGLGALAGITRNTLRKLEQGEATVGLDVFLEVCRVLSILDFVVAGMNPYETALGQSLAEQNLDLPKRVRR